jgi:tripartite-type tricarboxylate transporter receptor subunit TctC
VPTFAEAGLPNFELKSWYGVLAPAGLAKPLQDRLSGELARILGTPEVSEKLSAQGMDPFVSTSEQFATRMKSDLSKFAQLIKAANIKFEQ